MITRIAGWAVLVLCGAGPALAEEREPIRLPPVEVRAPYPLIPAQYRHTPLPPYPGGAREQGVEGVVLLEVHVKADGGVGEVRLKASSGAGLLDEAALKSVKGWTFAPAKRGPRAVDSWVEVPVKFALTGR
ncbi:MAG: energy transducer TonB [Candidatus Rokuibacteriota bacterium]